MDLHQVLDDMSTDLVNEDQMADNVMTSPNKLTNATVGHLDPLNEDCILEIFTRQSLTPFDLCALAEICPHLKAITGRILSTGMSIHSRPFMGKDIIVSFCSKNHVANECTFEETERILKNFGPYLSELSIDGNLAIMNLIKQFCTTSELKCLKLTNLGRIEGVTQQIDSIVFHLTQLHISFCNLPVKPWNIICESLMELEVSSCENGCAFLNNNFPILERFTFHFKYGESNTDAINQFVTRHGHLKIIDCQLLNAISCSCKEMEEITLGNIGCAFVDISHLQNLTKLKVLRLALHGPDEGTSDNCKVIDFERAFQSLKTMEISFENGEHVVPSKIFDVLSQVQSLRELILICCNDDVPYEIVTQLTKLCLHKVTVKPCLLNVITQLINLEELELESLYDPLEIEEFYRIVNVVERRVHVLTLRCHFDFTYEENCNDKQKVKLIQLTSDF